jgi:hypothetical protein
MVTTGNITRIDISEHLASRDKFERPQTGDQKLG